MIKLTYPGREKNKIPEINAAIIGHKIIVTSAGITKSKKIVMKKKTYTHNDFIYKILKTQINFLKREGIKLLINNQNPKNLFFSACTCIMHNVLETGVPAEQPTIFVKNAKKRA